MAKRTKNRPVTDQEWLFCHEFVMRGNMLRAIEMAYPKLRSRHAAHRAYVAKRVMNRPAVAAQIEQMRADLRATQRLTIDQHLTILADIRDQAREAEQFAAAARCEELRGRAAGFYYEQHVHVHDDRQLDRTEIRNRLRVLLDANPRIREVLGVEEVKQIEVTQPVLTNASSEDEDEPRTGDEVDPSLPATPLVGTP